MAGSLLPSSAKSTSVAYFPSAPPELFSASFALFCVLGAWPFQTTSLAAFVLRIFIGKHEEEIGS